MSATKFTPETRDHIVEIIGEGRPLREAAYSAEVAEKTLKNWIARGRSERDEGLDTDYVTFVEAIEGAREEHRDRAKPMTLEELELEVSRSAKNGSVQAQKLYWEMIRVKDFPDPDKDKEGGQEQAPQGAVDSFDALDGEDELARRRGKTGAG